MASQDDPTLREAIEAQLNDRLFGTRTSMLCRVKSFTDTPRPMVTVQVAANKWKRQGGEIVFTPEAVLADVPVMELGWGPIVVRANLEPGDHGVLMVCDRDIDTWLLQSGGDAEGRYNPGLALIHDINDALFLPAIQPNASARTPDVGARELFIGDRSGSTAIRVDSVESKVTIKALTVDVETPGLIGGPYTVFGINAGGVGTHLGSNGAGPVVWTDNPASGVKGVKLT